MPVWAWNWPAISSCAADTPGGRKRRPSAQFVQGDIALGSAFLHTINAPAAP
jgi:hypothetical protein